MSSRQKSVARFNRRNRLHSAKGRPRIFLNTPVGRKLTVDLFMQPLADFLARKLPEQPDRAPKFLRPHIGGDFQFLALAVLSSLMDGIYRGWNKDDPSAEAKLKLAIGAELNDRFRTRWDAKQRLRAGEWLLQQALALDFFDTDADGFPCISAKWQPDADRIRQDMIWSNPCHLPHLKEPPDWSGWWKQYDDRLRAKFVRDWRPETRAMITQAFEDPNWEHARGANNLKKVPLRIDQDMVDLVEQFAVEVVGNTGAKRAADQLTVNADVLDARWCGDRAIWLDYNCDRRGRLYAIQHLSFRREDHVRGLFQFANGMKLGPDGTYWLEIHCANVEGTTDKMRRSDRLKWVADNRAKIQAIGSDPAGTFDLWKDANSPFCYVAACRELVAAWNDPRNFKTHLPIGFDGSANGLQHLSLLTHDHDAAELVNLRHTADDDEPRDVYSTVIAKVIELLKADDHPRANFWDTRLGLLGPKKARTILKTPIMAFAYSVTPPGATTQISDTFAALHRVWLASQGRLPFSC